MKVRLNINDQVIFRLSEEGEKILEAFDTHARAEMSKYVHHASYVSDVTHIGGNLYSSHLGDIMHIFGPACTIGSEIFLEGELLTEDARTI